MRKLLFGAIALLMLCQSALAQKQWMPAGTPGFSSGISAYTTMAVDKNNVKYIAFLDGPTGGKATVMKYTGTNWQVVGTAGFSSRITNNIVIAIDTNDVPHIAYQDNANGAKATVMKYDGTNWVKLGNGFSAGQAMNISLVFDHHNTPYVSYRDVSTGYKPGVMKYDGTNWVAVGSFASMISAGSDNVSIAIDNNNVPYLSYGISAGGDVLILKYNGSAWVLADTTGIGIGSANTTAMAFDDNNTFYFAANDGNRGDRGAVLKYNGTQWVNVGPAILPVAIGPFKLDNNGVPHVGYRGSFTGPEATVLKYDGTSWVPIGDTFFSIGNYIYMDMVFDRNNMPYVSYTDRALGDRTTVMKYDDCPPHTKVAICAVLTDTLTDSNLIVWDGGSAQYVDSYRAYREDNGNYVHIGTVANTLNSFKDTTANASVQSYKYKLTVWDSCKRETELDSVIMHKTVRLVFDTLARDTVFISWNRYEGIPNLTYTVKRSDNGGAFTTIASFSITGIDTTYADAKPPLGTAKYRIDMQLPTPCSSGGNTYSSISSNTITTQVTGINDVARNVRISVVPNPASDKLTVTTTERIEKIEAYNVTGKKVLTENVNDIKEAVLDVSSLPAGMYFVRINDVHNMRFIKR